MNRELEKDNIFLQTWWWDITTRGKWNEITVSDESGQNISWPVLVKSRFGVKQLIMPPLTMYSGPREWKGNGAVLSLDHLGQFDECFEAYSGIKQNLAPEFIHLDFLRSAGYSLTPRRTYRIDTSLPETDLFAHVKKKRRHCIRRGKQDYIIEQNAHIEAQIAIVIETLRRKQVSVSYDAEILTQIIKTSVDRNQGQVLTALTTQGEVAASIFLVWDQRVMYYLLGGYTEIDRSSFATSMLIWEAISLAREKKLIFDFEGSMDPNVARFFQSFGSQETLYYQIEKTHHARLKLIKSLAGK